VKNKTEDLCAESFEREKLSRRAVKTHKGLLHLPFLPWAVLTGEKKIFEGRKNKFACCGQG
jgi:hypothetical protein